MYKYFSVYSLFTKYPNMSISLNFNVNYRRLYL